MDSLRNYSYTDCYIYCPRLGTGYGRMLENNGELSLSNGQWNNGEDNRIKGKRDCVIRPSRIEEKTKEQKNKEQRTKSANLCHMRPVTCNLPSSSCDGIHPLEGVKECAQKWSNP